MENQIANDDRISRIWQHKMQEREAEFQKINKKRIKGMFLLTLAIRMLTEKRSKVEQKVKVRDIIQEYGNYASRVYAPKAFEGTFRDKPSATLQLAIQDTNTFKELFELERSLPDSIVNPKIALPDNHKLKSLEARKENQLHIELELMSAKIQERKQRDGKPDTPVKYAIKIERPPSRPTTPKINIPLEEEEEMTVAAIMLQKIIRGRIVQNEMYEGKERRRALINELRTRHILREADPTLESATYEKTPQRLFEIGIQSEYIGKQLDFYTKELVRLREERRIAIFVKLADRTRRMREAEQSGQRQMELERRKQEDIIFKQVMGVHQESVDSWLETLLIDSVDSTTNLQARSQVKEYASCIDLVRKEWYLISLW